MPLRHSWCGVFLRSFLHSPGEGTVQASFCLDSACSSGFLIYFPSNCSFAGTNSSISFQGVKFQTRGRQLATCQKLKVWGGFVGWVSVVAGWLSFQKKKISGRSGVPFFILKELSLRFRPPASMMRGSMGVGAAKISKKKRT